MNLSSALFRDAIPMPSIVIHKLYTDEYSYPQTPPLDDGLYARVYPYTFLPISSFLGALQDTTVARG